MKRAMGAIILISICIAGIIPYVNSLHNPFIWDEEAMIIGNPIIKEWRYLPTLFKTSIFGGPIKAGGFYRPIYMFSFMLNYRFSMLNTVSYHLFNIIFHIINALLLYILVLNLGLQRKVAWLTGLLFVLYPVNSQAVALIGGRIEVIFGVLFLLCMIAFLRGIEKSRLYFLLSIFLFILTIFTKESALISPFIMLVYTLIFLEEEKRKKATPALLALIGIVITYCSVRFFLLGNPFHSTLSLINEASFLERFYTFPRILLTYIQLIVMPVILKSEYHFVVHSFKDPFVWLGPPFLILLFLSAYRFLKPKKNTLFFLWWFSIGLLPYYNLIIPLHATLSEHWAYFSSMGFAVIMSTAIFNITDKIKTRRFKLFFAIVPILLMSFYVARIIERNKEWRDPFTLYKNDVKREPNSFLLHCNLGVEYFRRGMMEDAKKEFIASNETAPGRGYDVAYNNLGVIYAREGWISEAISCYKASIALNNYALAYANMGALYNSMKNYSYAISLLEEGVEMYPLDVELKYQLGVAYYHSGQAKLAKDMFIIVENLHRDYSNTKTFLNLMTRVDGEGNHDK